jgi:hypothetical protein
MYIEEDSRLRGHTDTQLHEEVHHRPSRKSSLVGSAVVENGHSGWRRCKLELRVPNLGPKLSPKKRTEAETAKAGPKVPTEPANSYKMGPLGVAAMQIGAPSARSILNTHGVSHGT